MRAPCAAALTAARKAVPGCPQRLGEGSLTPLPPFLLHRRPGEAKSGCPIATSRAPRWEPLGRAGPLPLWALVPLQRSREAGCPGGSAAPWSPSPLHDGHAGPSLHGRSWRAGVSRPAWGREVAQGAEFSGDTNFPFSHSRDFVAVLGPQQGRKEQHSAGPRPGLRTLEGAQDFRCAPGLPSATRRKVWLPIEPRKPAALGPAAER